MLIEKNFGFTLLELSIALAVVGILTADLGLPLASRMIERNQAKQNEQMIKDAKSALIGFAIKNGRLPRPAVSAFDGSEASGCVGDNGQCRGFLPWTTISLSRMDPYGQLLSYSVSENLAVAVDNSSEGNLQISTRTMKGEEIALSTSAAAVIVSHGKRNWGTQGNGEARADLSASNRDEDSNAVGAQYFQRPALDQPNFPGGEFDDVVEFLSTELLIGKIAGRVGTDHFLSR